MSKIVSGIRLIVPEAYPYADYMLEQWIESMKNKAVGINIKRQQSVPNEAKFQTKLAATSGLEWVNMVAPTCISKGELNSQEIKTAQMKNIMESYAKWSKGLDLAYATVDGVEAKRFKDAVDKKGINWAKGMGRTTLRFTGDKVRGRSVAPITGYWLTGDKRVEEMLRGGDTITAGGPLNIAKEGMRTALKAGIIQKLIQSGVVIVRSESDPAVIQKQNEVLNEYLKGIQDPSFVEFQPLALPDKSFCRYELENGVLYLNIQVVR